MMQAIHRHSSRQWRYRAILYRRRAPITQHNIQYLLAVILHSSLYIHQHQIIIRIHTRINQQHHLTTPLVIILRTVSQENRAPITFSNNFQQSWFGINKFWYKELSFNQHLIALLIL